MFKNSTIAIFPQNILKNYLSGGFFFIDFTMNILKKNIDGVISDELALDVYERALDLNLGRSADSFFLRKMSEEYLRIGDEATAQICFNESEKLKY